MKSEVHKATFATGCFWCAEAAFKLVPGVVSVVSGYAGGEKENPSYEEVSRGRTGHVEAVRVEYDPEKTSYQELLRVFWEAHDPTQENRQGPDVGPQYQAAVFYQTDEERELAEQSKGVVEQKLGKSVATKILPFKNFYPAEDYHKDYYEKNPDAPYAKQVIAPKLEKLSKLLARRGE